MGLPVVTQTGGNSLFFSERYRKAPKEPTRTIMKTANILRDQHSILIRGIDGVSAMFKMVSVRKASSQMKTSS